MDLTAYIRLMYMALATWTTQVVAAQKVSEALAHVFDRAATPSECAIRDQAVLRSSC